MENINDYKQYLTRTIEEIMAIDSPSGFTRGIVEYLKDKAKEFGYPFSTTNKGCAVITVEGKDHSQTVGLTAHGDTLGCMVRSIGSDGAIRFTRIGGPQLATLDGEYCRIITRSGKIYTGTLLSRSCSSHVYADAATIARNEDNMWIRLDEVVRSAADVAALGIATGDIVAIDPKTTVTDSGFIKSRFLDDKASVACFITLLKMMSDAKIKPQYDTKFFVTVYEEVGHGGAAIADGLTEMIAVDMGCIGLDLNCTEYDVSICCKDGGGPYDYELTGRLIKLAQQGNVKHVVDMYPFYGSDIGAMWRAGYDVRGALIGPGIHASHGMERTHISALIGTIKLISLYLGV